jgi:hypothetical protein
VYEHLQQGLIAESLALGELSSLSEVGLRQANGDLHGAFLVHLSDQAGAAQLRSRGLVIGEILLYECSPGSARPPIRFLALILEFGMSGVFLVIGLTPLGSLRVIVASLSGVGLAVLRKPNLPFGVLNITENRVIQQRLLRLFRFDLMRPNFAEIIPIPFEHRKFNCVCNASPGVRFGNRSDTSCDQLRVRLLRIQLKIDRALPTIETTTSATMKPCT